MERPGNWNSQKKTKGKGKVAARGEKLGRDL